MTALSWYTPFRVLNFMPFFLSKADFNFGQHPPRITCMFLISPLTTQLKQTGLAGWI